MKDIPFGLQELYDKPGTSTAFFVKIVTKDNVAYGFTSLDTNETIDDGEHIVTYDSMQELRPQNIQQEASFETDNTELTGWFNQAIEQMALTGQFDGADVTIYKANYLRLEAGLEITAFGTIGEIDIAEDSKGKRDVEYRGLTKQLQQKIVPLYSLTCRADFGDERCTMPFVWENGTIVDAGDNPRLSFAVSGISEPDNHFVLGVIEFLTGDNAGVQMEIESWDAFGNTKLSFLLPFPVTNGDTCRLRQDCDKTAANCKAYGNIINMRAEHLTPVENKALMVPGAYIKSTGSK